MITVGLLASGGLGKSILDLLGKHPDVELLFVLTDFGSTAIREEGDKLGVPVFSGNPRGGKTRDFFSRVQRPDVIFSINYLFIIEDDILKLAKRYAINIHGSLLPKYRGRTPHVWAIINNEKETGLTAHIMDDGCDTGDIIEQVNLVIGEDMTGQDLVNEFQKQYPLLVKRLLGKIAAGNLNTRKQDDHKATYFGKRTPDDGQIDWNWQKERIRNWVRAQAKPYPGAFSLYSDKQIKIHKVEYSDLGFSYDTTNGTVIAVKEGAPYIKTPNGVLKLMEFEPETEFKTGTILI